MRGKFPWVSLLAGIVLLAAGTCALAVEGGLAGVKLDQPAVELLRQPRLGAPHFIGPAGTTVGLAAAQTAATGRVQPTAPPSPARPASPFFGTGVATPVSAGPAGRPTAASAATGRMLYWLYNRGAEQLVVGLLSDGTVGSVQVSNGGSSRTAHGIAIGSTYSGVVAAYGIPDDTLNYGNLLVVRYLDAGLTFTIPMPSARVNSILLEAIPTALAAPRAPVRPGAPRIEEEEDDDDDDDDE